MVNNSLTEGVIDKLEVDNAGALVITDDIQTILGVITERDIARGLKTYGRNVVDKLVADLMIRKVHTRDMNRSVDTCCARWTTSRSTTCR